MRKKKTDEHMMVSIITPAYNSADYIADTIQSVLEQSYQFWEMIIVDDASKDDTVSIVQKYRNQDDRIKLVRNEKNRGAAAARNIALDIAHGRYVAFLDADDMWHREKLKQQLEFMRKNNYVLTYTAYQNIKRNEICNKVIHVPGCMSVNDIYKNTIIACLTVMVDREQCGRFHMPLLRHTEDQITWQYIIKKCGTLAYGLDEPLAFYRLSESSMTNSKRKSSLEQWYTYREYYKFSIMKSSYYFCFYALNAIKKHFM